jgi:hypothetical protein
MQPSYFIADDKFSDVIACATQRGLERRSVDTDLPDTEESAGLLWRNLVATDHKQLNESQVGRAVLLLSQCYFRYYNKLFAVLVSLPPLVGDVSLQAPRYYAINSFLIVVPLACLHQQSSLSTICSTLSS